MQIIAPCFEFVLNNYTAFLSVEIKLWQKLKKLFYRVQQDPTSRKACSIFFPWPTVHDFFLYFCCAGIFLIIAQHPSSVKNKMVHPLYTLSQSKLLENHTLDIGQSGPLVDDVINNGFLCQLRGNSFTTLIWALANLVLSSKQKVSDSAHCKVFQGFISKTILWITLNVQLVFLFIYYYYYSISM